MNLVQSFTNLIEQGEKNGLCGDNWKALWLMLSEKHLKDAHSDISRFTDDLEGLVREILNQINSENEVCKLRNVLMKITRSTTKYFMDQIIVIVILLGYLDIIIAK